MPENLSLVSTAELIYGTGEYEEDLAVDMSFAKNAAANEYQVHGHRNYEGVPTQVNEHCFNLDGAVEMGGQLRALELSEEGFSVVAIGSPLEYVSKKKTCNAHTNNEKVKTVHQLLESFGSNPYIKEKALVLFLLLTLRAKLFIIKPGMTLPARQGAFISIRKQKEL